jgi:hypothetical protein
LEVLFLFRTGEHVALNERGKALRTDEMKGRVGVVMGVKDNFTVEIKGVKYSAPTERIKVFWENAQTVWTERPEHLLSLGK